MAHCSRDRQDSTRVLGACTAALLCQASHEHFKGREAPHRWICFPFRVTTQASSAAKLFTPCRSFSTEFSRLGEAYSRYELLNENTPTCLFCVLFEKQSAAYRPWACGDGVHRGVRGREQSFLCTNKREVQNTAEGLSPNRQHTKANG